MSFWNDSEVMPKLLALEAELVKKKYSQSSLLKAILVLVRPLSFADERNFAKQCEIFFAAFRVFETHIFLNTDIKDDLLLRNNIFMVFELLSDLMCQYYWNIRQRFDRKLFLYKTVSVAIISESSASENLQGMLEQNQYYLTSLQEFHGIYTPYYAHKEFTENFPGIIPDRKNSQWQKKIFAVIGKSYLIDRRFELYQNLLEILEPIRFTVVNGNPASSIEETLQWNLITFYFRMLNDLFLTNVQAKEYDLYAAEKFVSVLFSEAHKSKTHRVPSNPQTCQECKAVNGSVIKCKSCPNFACPPCLKAGVCSECFEIKKTIPVDRSNCCILCSRSELAVASDACVPSAYCSANCGRFICNNCQGKSAQSHKITDSELCHQTVFIPLASLRRGSIRTVAGASSTASTTSSLVSFCDGRDSFPTDAAMRAKQDNDSRASDADIDSMLREIEQTVGISPAMSLTVKPRIVRGPSIIRPSSPTIENCVICKKPAAAPNLTIVKCFLHPVSIIHTHFDCFQSVYLKSTAWCSECAKIDQRSSLADHRGSIMVGCNIISSVDSGICFLCKKISSQTLFTNCYENKEHCFHLSCITQGGVGFISDCLVCNPVL